MKILKNILRSAASILFVALFLSQCMNTPSKPSEVLVNPVDPISGVYTKPATRIVFAPSLSETLTIPQATIIVDGNAGAAMFSYKIDSHLWTEWSTRKTIIFTDLDEGYHRCIIRARHKDTLTIEENPPSVEFYVNAVNGPSLLCVPRKVSVKRDSQFTIQIYAEEVFNVAMTKVLIDYNKTFLKLMSVKVYDDSNSVFIKAGGYQIVNIVETDESNGRITLSAGIYGKLVSGVSGTGPIGWITFKPIAATSSPLQVSIVNGSLFRTSNNINIPLNTILGSSVEVQ